MATTLTNDNSGQSSQLITSPGVVRPAYGFGTKKYGVAGVPTKGREAHVQFREQNSGFAPSEDYRPAKFLPGLWRDLDRNGTLVTIEGGAFVGPAAIVTEAGATKIYEHNVMPANAGVPQQLIYTSLDQDITVDLDTITATNQSGLDLRVNAAAVTAGTTTRTIGGNKPLGYAPTHELSTAWEEVFANQKFMGQSTIKTSWLNMYPVNNVFMYGGTLTNGTNVAAIRAASGFGGYSVLCDATAVTTLSVISGILPGDKVMPNPILPGTLISVADFVKIAVALAAAEHAHAGDDNTGITAAIIASGLGADPEAISLNPSIAYAYAQEHIVGKCFKRQRRATVGSQDTSANPADGYILNTQTGEYLTGHDIYASTYRYMVTPPGLGLSGASTGGIEADQNSALAYAKAINGGVDVVFINVNVK